MPHQLAKKYDTFLYVPLLLDCLGLYSINLGLQKYPEFVDGDWDMVKMQPYIDWAAPMEYLLAFSFIATLYSFENELNGDEEE